MGFSKCDRCKHWEKHTKRGCRNPDCDCPAFKKFKRVSDLKNCLVCNKELVGKNSNNYACSAKCRRLATYNTIILKELSHTFQDPIEEGLELSLIGQEIIYEVRF